ncbi:hypothetical protein D917_07156 [Trichinella nativa]|uniref:Uncharacterized protein n=1 Tax=Trichinella nativa TaxID=6335 RepID=A0A1Y3EUE3_9BILA|nr:hypothetical protein D917_07156 [Trichinella nativa]
MKPEKIFFTVDERVSCIAFVVQFFLAFGALQTTGVVFTVEHFENEPIQNWLFTSGAIGKFYWKMKKNNNNCQKSVIFFVLGRDVKFPSRKLKADGTLMAAN